VLRSLRHYQRSEGKRSASYIGRLEEKSVERKAEDDLPSKDEKVQAIVRQTNIEAASKATLGDVSV